MKQEVYLGDGVYARWEDWFPGPGGQIWLRTERDGTTHTVALDTVTFAALIEFGQRFGGSAHGAAA